MTDDLDTLRPEVSEAVEHCDRNFALAPYNGHRANWPLIRAELLRLQSTESRANEWQLRAERAEAELASAARMHQQLLDTLGANDQADAMRIIAQHHARELAQQEPPK